jgi:hypothetical protein
MAARNALVMIGGSIKELPPGDTLAGTGVAAQIMVVREEQASGTGPGTPSAAGSWLTRVLNTIQSNSISGATLASNAVSLPAGTYLVRATASAVRVDLHRARLYNVTGSAALLYGTNGYGINNPDSPHLSHSEVVGVFTLATTSSVRIEHYVQTATSNGWGRPVGQGVPEVYTQLFLEKIA